MELRERVKIAYSDVAIDPEGEHAFPAGAEFAHGLGYPKKLLETVPETVRESFAGVSNLSVQAAIPQGSRVLDLGCGAGLDSFVAGIKVGPRGHVFGVDFSRPMIEKACSASEHLKTETVSFAVADGERLPFPAASVDLVLVNGIFNLNPRREEIFPELVRVLASGGKVFAAELILRNPLSESEKASEENWFA